MGDPSVLGQQVDAVLAAMASDEAAPSGGAAAALTVAMSAALAGMAARLGTAHLDDADRLAADADTLRERVAPLADADAAAYREVLAAYRLPRDDLEARSQRIREALTGASDVPLAVAEAGYEVADLGLRLAQSGNPNLAGDALTATLLASSAARSAAALVLLNVADGGADDGRADRARELEQAARQLDELARA